jgi:hypothetical protein
MRTSLIPVSGVALALMACASGVSAQTGKPFEPGCDTLPFESIKSQDLTIDSQCGIDGTAKTSTPSALQNELKNNFCAQGSPVELTFADFGRLQGRASSRRIRFGSSRSLPADRSKLKDILTLKDGTKVGEGTVVTLEGFVFGAQHSNTKYFRFGGKPGSGESVNCKSGEVDRNDIHIQLVETKKLVKKGKECKSVTAEISPHFRPAAWDRFDINPRTNKHLPGDAPPLPLSGARVRLTGQLFFDASHSPCRNGKGSPARKSIWEIHPVYAIEVFDEASNAFVPLEQWAENH